MESKHLMSGDTSRRSFLKTTAAGAAAASLALTGISRTLFADETKTGVQFLPLPYAENSLAPYMSAKTLHLHHDKHYRKYVSQVIERVQNGKYQNASLQAIIRGTEGGITLEETLQLMAIMAWNHEMYWKSMKPNGGGELPSKLKKVIIDTFGSVDAFKKKFKDAAMQFGSGWAWLVLDKGVPAVTYTTYHDTPLLAGQTPLLTIDTWEHAYYLDYQDRKDEYVDAFINHLANWSFAESMLPTADKKSQKK
jgi:superoxide dismutase, Fe-Mn family